MPEIVFYDGHCGLCHHFVTFLISRDTTGALFQFAPLDSETFLAHIPESTRATLPNSVVILTDDNTVLVRSRAALHALARLGGVWRHIANVCRLVPRPLSDLVYDTVAILRLRISKRPEDTCPIVPPELRNRFLV